MKSFKEKIYDLTNQIPKGKVATYGQLAILGGKPKAARSIGGFMRTNTNAPTTPCHRVVAKDGSLTGYSIGEGIATKKALLENEGVHFIKGKVDIQKSLWSGVV